MNMSPSDRSLLWELCFGDAPDVAESFFEIPDIITLTEYSNGTLIGMASLIPAATDSGALGYYAYGVCTHPHYRGCGVFKTLMERCEKTALENALDFICLIPATERLAETYLRMGYSQKIELYDAPRANGTSVFSRSLAFDEFAKPDTDTAPCCTVSFGVMKPLSSKITLGNFYFAAAMGER